jgi:hypothetical protein
MLHVSPFVNYLSGENPRCEDEKPLPPRPSNLVPSSVPIVSSNPGPNPKLYDQILTVPPMEHPSVGPLYHVSRH